MKETGELLALGGGGGDGFGSGGGCDCGGSGCAYGGGGCACGGCGGTSTFLRLYESVHKCTSPPVKHLPRVDKPRVQYRTTPCF